MRKIIVLLAAIGIMSSASAQDYKFGAGVRFGTATGLDFKWNVSPQNSLQFNIAYPKFRGISFFAGYEWNWTMATLDDGTNFKFFAGPALQLGAYDWREHHDTGFLFGFGGLCGVEYKFNFPLALSFDYRPTIAFSAANRTKFQPWGLYDFGLTARFTF